ncbi:hypothetical protein GCM10010191_66010 [Actinomadura vinacea]|uniref:Phage shock protein PspC N-terminal domain-containing protein n=1 Tax=Actinomadura vinacea TaxID=115336 RepID=A0ABP5X3A3_9ACTN
MDQDESLRDLKVSIGDHLTSIQSDVISEDLMRSTLERMRPAVLRRLTKRSRKLRKQDAPGGVASDKASGSGVCNGIAAAQGLSVAWARGLYVAISFLAGALLAPVGDGYPMLAVFGPSILVCLGLSVFLQPVATRAEYARLRAPHLER